MTELILSRLQFAVNHFLSFLVRAVNTGIISLGCDDGDLVCADRK